MMDAAGLDRPTRDALAELLLALADDEFVLGFWDSEWTGIAPMLEEDVAFSSLAQDEIGHARAYHELRAGLTGEEADQVAFGRAPGAYRHARLLDHPRTDWAFSVARRWLYDTADAVRLESLARSSHRPLADLVAKIRREERYHLMHTDAWVRRLAGAGTEARARLAESLELLWPDAQAVFTPTDGEARLVEAGILPEPSSALRERWLALVAGSLRALELRVPQAEPPPTDGRSGERAGSFQGLWAEFTSVARLEPGATW